MADTEDYLIECCADWLPETRKINAPLFLAQARNPHLSTTPEFDFKKWLYCPWCAAHRDTFVRNMRMKMSEAASKGFAATTSTGDKINGMDSGNRQ